MTDVRSLLRNERATRRITHPDAVYTRSGALTCNICGIAVKSETFWDKHLRSAEHAARKQQFHTAGVNKKRKADNNDSIERKKAKSDEINSVDGAGPEDDATPATPEAILAKDEDEATLIKPTSNTVSNIREYPTEATSIPTDAVDEDEWAAFERDVATPPPEPTKSVFTSSATISAAPLSAAELAAQAREEQSAQKGRREAEAEEEHEEASRQLEDEFEQMSALEDRVKRLKEKREALRQTGSGTSVNLAESSSTSAEGTKAILISVTHAASEAANKCHDNTVAEGSDDNDEDDDEEDDQWDPWR